MQTNSLIDAMMKGGWEEEELQLTDDQKEANLFAKKMLQAKARTAYVNKEYFRPLYQAIKGKDYDENDMKIASAVIVFNDKIKKYYFEK